MKVLSLFDGMSCAQIALNKLGIKDYTYYASEIDKHAIKVTQANYPNTIQLGDVTKIKGSDLGHIDLLIGGSPCQGFSSAGKQLNFNDPRSVLFFEYVRILNELKEINSDIKFVLENVKMAKEHQDVISQHLGVEPVTINSSLLSAQNRVRLYWANFKIPMPEAKSITIKNILNGDSMEITERMLKKKEGTRAYRYAWGSVRTTDQKSKCLTARGQLISNAGATNLKIDDKYFIFSQTELERLQTVPDGYTKNVIHSHAAKMLGNGFTVDVIVHILKNLNESELLNEKRN